MRNIPKEILEVPEEIVVMPELKGGGILRDLHQAMVRDESGRLKALLEDFMTEIDETSRKKRKKVKKSIVFDKIFIDKKYITNRM